jgi:hypothetical protein
VTYRKKLRIEMQELEEGINSINEKWGIFYVWRSKTFL